MKDQGGDESVHRCVHHRRIRGRDDLCDERKLVRRADGRVIREVGTEEHLTIDFPAHEIS